LKKAGADFYFDYEPSMPSDQTIEKLYAYKLAVNRFIQFLIYRHERPKTAPFDYYSGWGVWW
jgi:hypothetical protein